MKGFTRLTAITLSLAMIIASMFSVGVFADAVSFTDVAADYQYNQAITSLVAKGIINGYTEADGTSTFKPENTITRAEFAKLLVLATTAGVTHSATTDRFPDLALDHWANTYIAAAVNMGAINGYEDGTFRPENPVSYGEAVKMLVCTLNYGSIVPKTEPWYNGYINVATSIGILKGAAGLGSNEAKRGLVAQLIFNTNNSSKLVQTGTDMNGNPIYKPSSGKGSNSDIIDADIEEMSGVVTAVFEDTIEGISYSLNKQQIKVDNDVYYIGENSIDSFYQYLGKEIEFTYEEDGAKKVIIDFEEGRNESLTVVDVDIDTINGREIQYYEGNKKEKLALASDLYVVYNGYGVEKSTITDSFIAQYLDVENGEITFVNNDGKSDYDVAFVTSYETMFVKNRSEDAANGTVKIYDEHGNISDITLKNGDCKVYKVTAKGGNKTEVTGDKPLLQVAANTVVSIAAPIGKTEGTEVIISTVKLTGKSVDSVSSYDITIGGEDYDFSAYYTALVDKDSSKYEATKGDAGTFYLDFLGRLAYYSKSQTAEPYGYLAAIDDDDDVPIAYIFKADGKWLNNGSAPLAKKVSINGTKVEQNRVKAELAKTAAIVNKDKPANIAVNADVAQLIKYRYEDGEITAIYTINPDSANLDNGNIVPGKFIADADNETEATAFTKGTTKLKYENGTFKSVGTNGDKPQFKSVSSSTVFFVPYDRTVEFKDYKKKSLSTTNTTAYLVEPYDVTGGNAKVILIYVANGTTDANIYMNSTNIAFIHKKGTSTKDDGYKYFDLWKPSSSTLSKEVKINDNVNISDINEGDVIRYVIENEEISGIQKIFVGGQLYEIDLNDASGLTTKPATSNHLSYTYKNDTDYYQIIYGCAATKYEDEENTSVRTISLVADGDSVDNWKSFNVKSSTKFYKFEELEGERDVYGFVPKTADDCFVDINTIEGSSASDATKLLAIKLGTDDTLTAVYILE